VTILQSAADDHPTLREHRIAVGLYDHAQNGIVRRRRVEVDVRGERTDVPELVGEQQPDLLLLNDDDLTFTKVRLDERSRQTVVRGIGRISSSLARALCWTAATDMLRDAELPARDYVELVLAGVERESDVSVVQTVLAAARMAIHQYADPPDRLMLLARWASALRRMAGTAEPGSDAQLAFTRAWAAVAASPEHVDDLRALLETTDGGTLLPGLDVDTDLRWSLVHRLVILGAVGADAIESELARDHTATGRRHAAYARAARPTEQAKEEAWAQSVESDELPNALLFAAVDGFAQPEQHELVRPYVGRYLDAVPRVWSERTSDTARAIVARLFPRILADRTTADMVRAWLDHTEAPPAPRRLVVEGLADIDRALRAQACDHEAATTGHP